MSSGRIACGGGCDPERLRIEPTVLLDITENDPVMGEEIFGPLLPVLPCGPGTDSSPTSRKNPALWPSMFLPGTNG